MVRNNHLNKNRGRLNDLLRLPGDDCEEEKLADVLEYARFMARLENLLVVVSDMAEGRSHIIAGDFAGNLDLGDYRHENSIWEDRILSLMTDDEVERKYLMELRYFHYLKKLPRGRRRDYYLMSKLRFRYSDGQMHDVLHRMFYIFDARCENVRYAICSYGPLAFDLPKMSYAVNSITGLTEILTDEINAGIMSYRERQVLALIDMGMKSKEIAESLNISINTVSRHRQEIIAKLQVKNTHEACRVAKNLNLI